MRIGIDLDNVCVTTTVAVLEYLAERGAPRRDLKDIRSYWIEKNYPPEYSLLIKEAFESKEMWKKVRMIKGAKKYIKKLYEDGHELYFVTSSLPENLRKKIKHLSRNLDFLPQDYVWKHTINIHRKQLLNLDVLIDDCFDNLWGERQYTSICYVYPWNCDRIKDIPEIIGCYDWCEIYEEINKLKEKKDGSKRIGFN